MANTPQARKRARQAIKRRVHNISQHSRMRTFVKRVKAAIVGGEKAIAEKYFLEAQKIIDITADKDIIHKNKAARIKSRLATAIAKL